MQLDMWQTKTKTSDVTLGGKAGIDPSYLSHIKRGRKTPSAKIALRISEATGKKVSVMEILFPKNLGRGAQ